jgi:hypothetical protein
MYVCGGVYIVLTLVEGRFQQLRCRGKSPAEWFCPASYVDGDTFGCNCELCLACDLDAGILFTAV